MPYHAPRTPDRRLAGNVFARALFGLLYAIKGGGNPAASSSGYPLPLPAFFLLICLTPASLTAVERMDYHQCLAACEEAFPNVVPSEKSCGDTITDIHFDMGPLRDFLLSDYRCRGRYRKACKSFKQTAISSLERLSTLTLESRDCRSLDAAAIARELALFDGVQSCRGDGLVTDIHDLLGRRRSYLKKINERQPRYQYTSRRFGSTAGEAGRTPTCRPGDKPRRYYVWPLLQFHNSLASLGAYQACMSRCRKPTAAERKLWALEGDFYPLKGELRKAVGLGKAGLASALSDRTGKALPAIECDPLAKGLEKAQAQLAHMSTLEQRLVALLGSPEPPVRAVEELVADVAAVNAAHGRLNWNELAASCRAEDETALALEKRRQRVLEALALGKPFSLKAVETFERAGPRGAPCTWTGECQVPLQCREGVCFGELTPDDIRRLLERAEQLRSAAMHFQLFDTTGLSANARQQVAGFEKEFSQLETRVRELGWTRAVALWRKQFDDELASMSSDLRTRLDHARQTMEERCSMLPADARAACDGPDEVRDLMTELTVVEAALADVDPLSGPRWLRLKVADLQDIGARLDSVMANAPSPDFHGASGGLPAALLIAIAVFAAVSAAFAVWWQRRRKRRHRPPEEEAA